MYAEPKMNELQLFYSAGRGDLAGVKKHIKQAGGRGDDGMTALMNASNGGYTDCVRALVPHEAGLAVAEGPYRGWTALMYAARGGYPNIVDLLCDKEAKKTNAQGRSALMLAIQSRSFSVVPRLAALELGLQDRNGMTALMLATWRGAISAVEQLLSEAGKQLTHEFVFEGTTLRKGTTALIIASIIGKDSIVRLLKGTERALMDDEGHNACWYARENGRSSIVTILQEEQKVPESPPPLQPSKPVIKKVSTPLHAPELVDDPILIPQPLSSISTSSSVSSSRNHGLTQLMTAAIAGKAGVVRLHLHEKGKQDSEGWTALMHAAKNGRIGCVRLLLDEVDIQNADGETALDIAAISGHGSPELRARCQECARILQNHLDGRTMTDVSVAKTALTTSSILEPNSSGASTMVSQLGDELGNLLLQARAKATELEQQAGSSHPQTAQVSQLLQNAISAFQCRPATPVQGSQMGSVPMVPVGSVDPVIGKPTMFLPPLTGAQMQSGDRCISCMIAPRNTVLYPCSHLCVCASCAHRLINLPCPLCRVPVTGGQRVM
ncbi:Ankyrin repeat protein 2 [Giardia muris]|uniref:Ankyrin repeat protein 2 n=1 Tax=Giardia muris TaxID=5742 RepID=A0A4Z1SYM5_GIAMU|nr:Ankyrin repeat protein 2 [Giardia muris]|eukprot:TNJ28598.1 Ankyrin repeat protein 2 [Giardia muris]